MLAVSIAGYFVAAALLPLSRRAAGRGAAAIGAAPFVLQLGILLDAVGNRPRVESYEWLPSLGLSLSLRGTALTLTIATVVAAVGLLIVAYGSRYFSDEGSRFKFLALLSLFAGGMSGLVLSDDLYGLFLFWEMTTVASFLLIGFTDEKAQSRAAAVQAVLVTSLGGLAMLGGFVLLAQAAGTSAISEIAAAPPDGARVSVALGLILIGAFSKSAQFPFHFWLPGAMAAPTPASAYLHSATMVKAGIVLLVLLAPGFSDHALWGVGVTGAGLITMSLGALRALRQHDLKLLLAHGTVSQLGFMVALIGLGLTAAALAVLLAHAAFKAALFLVVGIIDKKTGTRDIRHVAGLRQSSPALSAVAALAALSMAGIPPLVGFVAKEAAFDALIAADRWFPLVVIAAASALTVAYTARFWWGAFEEQPGGVEVEKVRVADRSMLWPPALLAAVSIVVGVVPAPMESIVSAAIDQKLKLVLWPGPTPALGVSAAAIAIGVLVHVVTHTETRLRRAWERVVEARPLPSAARMYQASVVGLNRGADVVTGIVQNGSLPIYLAVIVTTIVTVTGAVWLSGDGAELSAPFTNGVAETAVAAVVVVAAAAAVRARRRMAAVLMLGAAGFGVSGIYVTFGAPDLALTQLLVETFTIALFAFVLSRLPRRFGRDPRSLSRAVRITISLLVGAFVTGAALLTTTVTPDRAVAEFYVDQSREAGGRNVVNVILTNFRALDTLGEITVLAAAGIGVAALVRFRPRNTGKEA